MSTGIGYYCDAGKKDSFVNSAIAAFKTSIKTYLSVEIFDLTNKLYMLRDLGKLLVGEGTLFVEVLPRDKLL